MSSWMDLSSTHSSFFQLQNQLNEKDTIESKRNSFLNFSSANTKVFMNVYNTHKSVKQMVSNITWL